MKNNVKVAKRSRAVTNRGIAHSMLFYLGCAVLAVIIGAGLMGNLIPAFGNYIRDQFTGGADQLDPNLVSAIECSNLRCTDGCDKIPASLSFQGDCSNGICYCNKDYCMPFMDSTHHVCGESAKVHPIKVEVGDDWLIPNKFNDYKVAAPALDENNLANNCAWKYQFFSSSQPPPSIFSYLVLDSSLATSTDVCHTDYSLVTDSCNIRSGTYYVWGDQQYSQSTFQLMANYEYLCGQYGGYYDSAHTIGIDPDQAATVTVHVDDGSTSDIFKINVSGQTNVDPTFITVEKMAGGASACGGSSHPTVDLVCMASELFAKDFCASQANACGKYTVTYASSAPSGGGQDVVFSVFYKTK